MTPPVTTLRPQPVFGHVAAAPSTPRFAASLPLAQADEVHFGAKDPAPRKGVKNWVNRGLLALAIGGFWAVPGQIGNLHEAAESRTAIVQTVEGANQSPADIALDKLAAADTAVRDLPLMSGVEDFYADWLLRFQFLGLGLAAFAGMRKKTVRPEDVYGELHKRGYTGKDIKVGIVDSGYKPVIPMLGRRNVTILNPDDLGKRGRFRDPAGHGTAVLNLVRRALPDAQFLVTPYASKKQEAKLTKDLKALLAEAKKDPSKLTIDSFRTVFSPLIENIAKGVRKSVDEGCDVVNVSLSVEQAVQGAIMMAMASVVGGIVAKRFSTGKDNRQKPEYKQEMEQSKQLLKILGDMSKANETTEVIDDEIKSLYKPWLEALDYAQSKGATVVLASGNSGNAKSLLSNNVGKVNLLAAVDHPALMVVGSTDEEGKISTFSSEYNSEVVPDIAANGSGQISTSSNGPKRGVAKKVLRPLDGVIGRIAYANPPGTSFASPDVTARSGMMKAVNPSLSAEDIRALMLQAAQETSFSEKDMAKIKVEIQDRILKTLDINYETIGDTIEKMGRQVDLLKAGGASEKEINAAIAAEGSPFSTFVTERGLTQSQGDALFEAYHTATGHVLEKHDKHKAATGKPLRYSASLKLIKESSREELGKALDGPEFENLFAAELQGELIRRVGAGTIAGHRREAVELAEHAGKTGESAQA